MQPLFTPNHTEAEMFARLTIFAVAALALAFGNHAKAAPLSYGTYYDEQILGVVCSNTPDCEVYFSQLPSNNLLMLEKVNCYIQTTQPLIQVYVTISQTPTGSAFGRGVFVNPGPAVVIGGTLYAYTFQTDARILIGQGRYPFIFAETQSASSVSNMDCGIEGTLVTPIQ
jgi:hypothetical protein